ncbi:restriction endonuclease subunit S [Algoriphagus sp.]|uniref:restriction endonuclease subunit S n=1 Tax=Algoriphagus sp. TaxID=1872435 RepID=UPI00391BC416
MKKLFNQITKIQTGLFAKPLGEGDVIYLQVKHFDENGQLQSALHGDLLSDYISEKHLLKNGDVLFAAKGSKNFATVFEDHNKPAVASTSFFVIRPTNKKVLPQYLAWFLNSHSTLTLLKSQAIGSSIPSISKQVLENLEVAVPSIEIQKTILEIAKLRIIEQKLKQEIEALREKQIQQQIINALQ